MARNELVEQDVLNALATIHWDVNVAVLNCGQLPRDLYVRVNKVLESLGGKWNRKAKGHVFDGPCAEDLELVIEQRRFIAGGMKQLLGQFNTPDDLADRMAMMLDLPDSASVLEPSAGTGSLLRAVRRVNPNLVHLCAVEIGQSKAEKLYDFASLVFCMDFLIFNPDKKYDCVIMNPPFSKQVDVDHVKHAWDLLADGGRLVSIMSPGWTFRSNRKSVEFRDFVQANGSFQELPDGTFHESGTDVRTVLVTLDRP